MIIFTCRITWSVQISWRKMYIILKYRSSKTLNIQIIIILGKLFWYILLWLFLRLTVQIRIEWIPDFFSIRWNSPLFHICCSNILVEKQVLFFLVRCMIFVFVAIIRGFYVFKNFENYNTSKLFEMNQINNVVFSDIIYEFTWITLIEFCLTPKQYCKNVCSTTCIILNLIDEICSINHSGFQFLFVVIFSILIHLLTFGILTSLKRPRQF